MRIHDRKSLQQAQEEADPITEIQTSPTGAQMTRLVQSLRAARFGVAATFMLTGATGSVGTTYVARRLVEAALALDHSAGIIDFGAKDPAAEQTGHPRGPGRDHPIPLTTLRDFRQRIENSDLDVTILDAPPVVSSALAMHLLPSVQGAVLVVGRYRTTEREIRAALQTIRVCGGTCVGLVMNQSRS